MSEETQRSVTAGPEPGRVPSNLMSSPLLPPEPAAITEAESVEDTGLIRTQGDLDRANDFGQANHEYIREYIQFADQKAAVVLAAGTALLAYLFQNGVVELWMRPFATWDLGSFIAFVAMFALAIAVLSALGVVIPRMKGASAGLIYWQAVAQHSSGSAYADAVLALDDEHLTRARLEHCFELAQVCDRKYRVLNQSLRIGSLGLAASVLYLLFFG